MEPMITKCGKSQYDVYDRVHGVELRIKKNAYTGLWDIWNKGGGPAFARHFRTLEEAKRVVIEHFDA